MKKTFSLVIPVFNNAPTLDRVIEACESLNQKLDQSLEVICVVDGSPDDSFSVLTRHLGRTSFPLTLIKLSRNFGAFSAVRAGLRAARGNYFSVMAADLQEPPSLIFDIFSGLKLGDADIIIGQRRSREDGFLAGALSGLVWKILRAFVFRDLPKGGVDVFGCNQVFLNALLKLRESNTSLIGQLFWLGFNRKLILYDRLKRPIGKSGWSLSKKINYFLDSIYAFSDLPIKILSFLGLCGVTLSIILGAIILSFRIFGSTVTVPGYAATLTVLLFFFGLNSIGLGVVGGYAWRAYENTKERPDVVISEIKTS